MLAVLVIACANIANLLLARAAARSRKLAMRAALGASHARLMMQTFIESLVLGLTGGALGCAFAYELLRIFVAIAPGGLPKIEEAAVDGRVLTFALLMSLASSVLFGMVPAFRRHSVSELAAWRTAGSPRITLRSALVMVQIAVSMVLLTGAGVLLRSLWKLQDAPLGIQSEHVITARFTLGQQLYGRDTDQLLFFNELEQRLVAAPGVSAAAISDSLPPSGGTRGRPFSTIEIEGRPRMPEGTGGMTVWRYVTPGYFSALGIPLRSGRPFTEQDRDPHAHALVLGESLARRMFPNESALGKRVLKTRQGEWHIVVGVVADVKNNGPARGADPEFYLLRKPLLDSTFQAREPPTGWRAASVVVRTSLEPKAVATALRSIIAGLDATLPVELQTMRDRLSEINGRPRFNAVLLTVFAAMGALLAAVGLFGVMSLLVLQRRREIGVRMALGATPASIVRWITAQAMRWIAAGVVLGFVGSLAAAGLLRKLLYGVEPADPRSVIAALAVMCVITAAAAAGPARRAARTDPMETLRDAG